MFPQEIIDWMEEMAPLVLPKGSKDWERLQRQCSGYLTRANGQLSWMNFVEEYRNNADATRLVMQKALTEARAVYDRLQECIHKQELEKQKALAEARKYYEIMDELDRKRELEKQQGRELFQRLKAKRG
jgi:hypothetical protein